MDNRRKSPNKITLGMIKGKSASASISNIAIRFHADDEELEQVVQASSDSNLQFDPSNKQETVVEDETTSLSSSSQLSTPTSTLSDLTTSTSSSSSSVLGRLSKRSVSLESATPTETSSGDAWRLFREVRGRITKTVEEKIEEIKSDRKNKQKNKLGTKVEHSSISDSEDQSESSSSLKVSDNNLGFDIEKKDCDNSAKNNDNQINDSGRSTPLVCSSSSEKDDVPSSNVQKDKSNDEKKKDKLEDNDNRIEKKDKERSLSVCDEGKEKPEEKKKGKVDDEFSFKKEKKVRRFHFRDRFQGSPDKKKHEISVKFSSLKDEEESEDEKESVTVEYGLEASETEVEPAKVEHVPVVLVKTPSGTRLSILKDLLWAWRYTLLTLSLFIAHYIWPANYMLGFLVGTFLTIQVTSTMIWVQESFHLKQASNEEELYEGKSIYSGFSHPIFASSRYFTPCDDPDRVLYEGWMNEFSQDYSPDSYHISLTETVHVKLEGTLLMLSNPSTKIPKRAYWNEPEHKKLFNRQRLFDIAGCKVQLLPVGLTHKRIWSKKYPICVTLLKMSKMGVRYRSKGKITVDDDQPWLDPEVDSQTPVENIDNQDIFVMDPLEQPTMGDYLSDDKYVEGDKQQDRSETTSFCIDDPLREKVKLPVTNNNDSANEDDDDEEDFVRISPSLLNEFCIYLFARCDRQKEIWFRRLIAAAGFQNAPSSEKEKEKENVDTTLDGDTNDNQEKPSQLRTSETVDENPEVNMPAKTLFNIEQQYLDYMNRLGQKKVPRLPSKEKELNTKQSGSSRSSPYSGSPAFSAFVSPLSSDDMYSVCEEVMWVNAFVGRLLYDVLRDSFWLNKIQEKFQRKLSAIKLPYFMEELVISDIDFGETVPIIQRSSKPVLNEDGIWADLDIIYNGHFRVTIDTKLNLMKLKKAQATFDDSETAPIFCPSSSNVSVVSSGTGTDVFQVSPYVIQKSAIFDSDVEDSAESSSEELDIGKTGPITLPDVTPSSPGNTTSHKMLRMVDKIAASKYFQQVTEYKYIKRAMEGVSNTSIALVVEVRGLAGTLVLNFPPPPSNRLWYGFRPNPQLLLTAHPKVGDRTISLLHISTWIERRLRREFQKLLVLPNMDDLIIPVMNREYPS